MTINATPTFTFGQNLTPAQLQSMQGLRGDHASQLQNIGTFGQATESTDPYQTQVGNIPQTWQLRSGDSFSPSISYNPGRTYTGIGDSMTESPNPNGHYAIMQPANLSTWGNSDRTGEWDADTGQWLGYSTGATDLRNLANWAATSVGAYYGANALAGGEGGALSGMDLAADNPSMWNVGNISASGSVAGAAAPSSASTSTAGGMPAGATPTATTPASSWDLSKVASNPKVWQAGLGLAGAVMNSFSGSPSIGSSGGVSDYTKAAIATSNSGKYNEVGPYGSNTWTLRPGADPNNPQPGDYIRTTTFEPGQQQLLDQTTAGKLGAGGLAQSQVSDIAGGRQAVQDALYKQYTANYDQRYNRDEEALRTRLLNEGLDPNSEAGKNELLQFRQNKDAAYADAQQRAITGADAQQNSAVARLANILAMSGPSMPTSANSSGGNPTDLLTAANQTYNAQLAASNASKAQNTQNFNSLIALIAAMNGG